MKEVNNAVRFLLELAALVTFAIWGYRQSDNGLRILLAIALPVGFALLWGVFAVKDDPSRSGKTVVQTPGIIRLIMEWVLFLVAVWMLYDLGMEMLAGFLLGALIIHYYFSGKRIRWLLKQK